MAQTEVDLQPRVTQKITVADGATLIATHTLYGYLLRTDGVANAVLSIKAGAAGTEVWSDEAILGDLRLPDPFHTPITLADKTLTMEITVTGGSGFIWVTF